MNQRGIELIISPESGLGAVAREDGSCHFCVWAPQAETVEVRLLRPQARTARLEHQERGYHGALLDSVPPGSTYLYRLDGQKERPDPASRFQPEGVHGPSQVVDFHFPWDDSGWNGPQLEHYLIYEIHTGTFTPEGSFEAVIPHLDSLRDLGVTAVELMPVAQFPGSRNWGYDGAYPFAVQNSYGGPDGLKRLVSACHQKGLAVVLDVVYNHLGPEGNYLADFGPYFTGRYRTPWGPAMNFDGPQSDEVVRFFIESALRWLAEFHIDALRLDAIHGIVDVNARPFLGLLAEAVQTDARRLGRRIYVIAESDWNDVRVLRSRETGGLGMDAQWCDDFHHSLHTLLTGERSGYYRDFGRIEHLAKAFREGFVYSGQYSEHRRRRHGNSSRRIPARQFVVCAQNHDQVGNRKLGDRLSQLIDFEKLKLAAGVVLLSPFIPLLFMGEEYGETAPFQYFTSHSDPGLVEAVRRGRREEFAAFGWQGDLPDPQAESTFEQSCLNHDHIHEPRHRILREFTKQVIARRKAIPALATLSKEQMQVTGLEQQMTLAIRRWADSSEVLMVFNFASQPASLSLPSGLWDCELDSADDCWKESGGRDSGAAGRPRQGDITVAPVSMVLFARKGEAP